MGLYDRMFLISEDRYRSKSTNGAGSTTADVLGDVQESQVNNIETHGGTVVIGSGGGRIPAAAAVHSRDADRLNLSRETKKGGGKHNFIKPKKFGSSGSSLVGPNPDGGSYPFVPYEDAPGTNFNPNIPPSRRRTSTTSFSQTSASSIPESGVRSIVKGKRRLGPDNPTLPQTRRIASAKRKLPGAQAGTALRPRLEAAIVEEDEEDDTASTRSEPLNRRRNARHSLRRQALQRSTAERVSAENEALDKSLQQRLDRLLGRSPSPPPAEAVNSAQEQAVLHDLRSVHRRERTRSPRSTTRSNPKPILRKGRPGPVKQRRLQDSTEDNLLPFPPFRYLEEEEEEELRNASRPTRSRPRRTPPRRAPPSQRRLTAADRREVDNEIENIRILRELEELEAMEHLPTSAFETGGKRKATNQKGSRSKYVCVPQVDPPEGRKRKRPVWEDLSREKRWQETLTEIPYKSKGVTYDTYDT